MIVAEKLTKQYGKARALDEVSFVIESGESVALWGANGAGKTTALRCVLGVHSFSGQLTVNGVEVGRNGKQVRAMIGYVPQEATFHDMAVGETLHFYARLKKVAPERIAPALEQVQLSAHSKKSVQALSGGMKQRLALAVGLLSDPPILILDEPTANLDAQAQHDFIQLIQSLNQAGKTVVFSSHRLDEVGALAQRVLVLEEGKLVLSCTPDQLAPKLGLYQWLRIHVSQPQRDDATRLLQDNGFTFVPNGQAVYVRINAGDKMAPLRALESAQIRVQDFDLVENGDAVPAQDNHHD